MPDSPRPLSVRRRMAFAAFTLAIFCGAAELLSRLFVDDSSGGSRFRQINEIVLFLGTQPSDLMLDYDPERFWKLRPDVVIEDPRNQLWPGRVSNSLGFRSPEFLPEKPAGVTRIVCFGDSSTFGIGATMDDTWPAQLESMLNEEGSGRFQVVNAGVPGYTSYQGLQHMKQELDRLQPDIVFASYANNDFWRWGNHTDVEHRDRLDNTSLRRLLMHSRAVQVVDRLVSPAAAPSVSAWAEVTTFNYFQPKPDWVARVPLDQFETNLRSMYDLCDRRNTPLVLVLWPDQPQAARRWSPRIAYHQVIRQVAAEHGAFVSDVVGVFQRNRARAVRSYIPNDIVHVNRDGNRFAAQAARSAVMQCLFSNSVAVPATPFAN